MQQYRRGIDAIAMALFANRTECEVPNIVSDVTRIHFDDDVGGPMAFDGYPMRQSEQTIHERRRIVIWRDGELSQFA